MYKSPWSDSFRAAVSSQIWIGQRKNEMQILQSRCVSFFSQCLGSVQESGMPELTAVSLSVSSVKSSDR